MNLGEQTARYVCLAQPRTHIYIAMGMSHATDMQLQVCARGGTNSVGPGVEGPCRHGDRSYRWSLSALHHEWRPGMRFPQRLVAFVASSVFRHPVSSVKFVWTSFPGLPDLCIPGASGPKEILRNRKRELTHRKTNSKNAGALRTTSSRLLAPTATDHGPAAVGHVQPFFV